MYGSPQMQYPNMPMHAPYGYLPARPGQEGMIPMMPGPMPPGMVPIYGSYPGQVKYQVLSYRHVSWDAAVRGA